MPRRISSCWVRTGKATEPQAPVGRLAPSPTGALHLGNARTFLATWLSIRSRGGRLILRIEDLDHPKVKPWAVQQALDDLAWLKLDWDAGPITQSDRIPRYAAALDRLCQQGAVYPCTCSRRDVAAGQSAPHATDTTSRYPGTCAMRTQSYDEAAATLPPGRLPAWRFLAPDRITAYHDGFHGRQAANVAAIDGDFVIARHPLGAGYMLAVIVDDFEMGITEIMRGDDLLPATHRQLLLQEALGMPAPQYIHLPLVVSPDGRRLAKRHGDTRISALRDAGIAPEAVIGLLAWWCGWADWGAQLTARDLIPRYRLDTIPRDPVVLTDRIKHAFRIGCT